MINEEEVSIHLGQMEFRTAAGVIPLSSGEFDLIAYFCLHPRTAISRMELLRAVHGLWPDSASDQSINVAICRIKKKLAACGSNPHIIRSIRHKGYYFTPAVKIFPTVPGATPAPEEENQ